MRYHKAPVYAFLMVYTDTEQAKPGEERPRVLFVKMIVLHPGDGETGYGRSREDCGHVGEGVPFLFHSFA